MINTGQYIEELINWMMMHFSTFFDALNLGIGSLINGLQYILFGIPFYLTIAAMVLLTWMRAGHGVAIFTLLGLLLTYGVGFWEATIQTLALTLSSACLVLIVGVPIGVWATNSNHAEEVIHLILDLTQITPTSVYLIPTVLFFGLRVIPGVFATIIFTMPPVIRLTGPGIRQVPKSVVEVSRSFGATRWQLLYKMQLPLALPIILTGVNQTVMMSLSMVVVAAMIATGGLGEIVLKGITQTKTGLGFEGGIAVVILVIILGRITQGMIHHKNKKQRGERINMRKYRIIGSLLLLLAVVYAARNPDTGKKKISIAYTNWPEGIAMSHLAKVVLEGQRYGVELLNADVAPIFASVSRRKADVFMDAWLPVAMKGYMGQYGDQIEFIGEVYNNARVGLVVPQCVSIDSIRELASHKGRFPSEIVGIDIGAGIMKATDKTVANYRFNEYKLLTSSSSTMLASLQKAMDKEPWIIIIGWTPYWIFDRYPLEFLHDPKSTYGSVESIYVVGWKGFTEKDPFAAKFSNNTRFTTKKISSLMKALKDAQMDEEDLVRRWRDEHQELIESQIPESQAAYVCPGVQLLGSVYRVTTVRWQTSRSVPFFT